MSDDIPKWHQPARSRMQALYSEKAQPRMMWLPDITTPKIQQYTEMRMSEVAASATINRELSPLKRMLNLAARQTPPKVVRVPYFPMLKENYTRKGFFEHEDFLALRDALPSYLKGFVTFGYKYG